MIPLEIAPCSKNIWVRLLGGHKDRQEFLVAWLAALIHGWTESQTFLYIEGPGATGKSLFGTISRALVGTENTITTSLKALNSDPFEIANLMGKRLILISETERYRGDMSVLKMITGGDPLFFCEKQSCFAPLFFCEKQSWLASLRSIVFL